jgi:hypothetical protein
MKSLFSFAVGNRVVLAVFCFFIAAAFASCGKNNPTPALNQAAKIYYHEAGDFVTAYSQFDNQSKSAAPGFYAAYIIDSVDNTNGLVPLNLFPDDLYVMDALHDTVATIPNFGVANWATYTQSMAKNDPIAVPPKTKMIYPNNSTADRKLLFMWVNYSADNWPDIDTSNFNLYPKAGTNPLSTDANGNPTTYNSFILTAATGHAKLALRSLSVSWFYEFN